jgi:hypothetical protein
MDCQSARGRIRSGEPIHLGSLPRCFPQFPKNTPQKIRKNVKKIDTRAASTFAAPYSAATAIGMLRLAVVEPTLHRKSSADWSRSSDGS